MTTATAPAAASRTRSAADGTVARTLFFTGGAALRADDGMPDDPELVALYEERQAAGRRGWTSCAASAVPSPSEQYTKELERLLVDLALKSREIRQREAAKER